MALTFKVLHATGFIKDSIDYEFALFLIPKSISLNCSNCEDDYFSYIKTYIYLELFAGAAEENYEMHAICNISRIVNCNKYIIFLLLKQCKNNCELHMRVLSLIKIYIHFWVVSPKI